MWKSAYPCRCRQCGARRTHRHHPDTYSRVFRFLVCRCGSTQWRVDEYRRTREHKRSRCFCDAYWFPHRRGSGDCDTRRGTLESLPF